MRSHLPLESDAVDTKTVKKASLDFKGKAYGPVLAILLTAFTFFASQILGAVLIVLGGSIFGYDGQATLQNIEDSTFTQFVFSVLAATLAMYATWMFVRARGLGWCYLGMRKKPKLSDAKITIGVTIVYFLTLIFVTGIVSQLISSIDVEQEQQLGFDGARTATQLLLVFVSLVVLPPIIEEIMIRGFLYSGLRSKLPKLTAAIVASILFGIAHLQLGFGAPPLWIAAIDTAILSLFLIYLREKTGSIWAGMVVHAIKNGLAFTFLFVMGTS